VADNTFKHEWRHDCPCRSCMWGRFGEFLGILAATGEMP
jgi:hypothetical protein